MRPPACLASFIIAAIRVTPTSTRRSDEISFDMNANPSRSRAWNSGTILMPWMPQTTASPARISRSLRQPPGPPRRRWPRPSAGGRQAPTAARADERLMIRRGVEVFRRTAVAIGRHVCASSASRDAAPKSHELLEQLLQRRRASSSDPHRNERRLVVGAADPKLEHLERTIVPDDGVEHGVQQL